MKLISGRGRAGNTSAATVGIFVAALIAASLVAIGATPASADAAPGTITTIAGTGTIGHDGDQGAATSATLDAPNDVVVGDGGNIFVADWSAHVVRMIAGQDCTVGSTCPFGLPTTKGDIYTVAGNAGTATSTGNGGPASAATLEQPAHLAFDNNGNLLIADLQANVVRLVASATCPSSCPFGLNTTTAGDIYAIAGNATASTTGDGGPATSAELNSPRGLAVTSNGVLYIADYGHNTIREVSNDGTITTLAGTGLVGPASATPVAATAATFDGPISLALNAGVAATLYVSDASNHAIRTVDLSTNMVNTIAGVGRGGYSGDGGPAASAKLFFPDGLATDAKGNLFIADYENNVVREIPVAPTNGMTTGDIYTVAGDGTAGRSGDTGTATAGQLHGPSGVAVDSAGNLIIADTSNHVVRQVSDIENDTSFASTDPVPAALTYRQAVLADSPTLYYRLDEPAGTHAANSAGAGDGATSGTYSAADTLGATGALADISDTAVSGNGSGSMLAGPAAADLPHGPAPRTVEFWMNEQAPGPNEYALFEYGADNDTASGQRFGLSINASGGLHFEGYSTNLEFAAPAGHSLYHGPSGPAVWHHVALVYDGTSLTPYIDGISLGTVAIALHTGTFAGPLKLGSALDSMGGNFPGSIDEFAIYPTALTADQINAHIAVSGRPPNAPTDLTATAGDHQVQLSWAASTTNTGTPDLTAYSVRTVDSNGDTASVTTVPTTACTSGTCTVAVTDLDPATAADAAPYTAAVAGISPAGVGPATTSAAFTPTGSTGSYRTLVLGKDPDLYYRLDSSYHSGVADSSGHGLDGYAPPTVDTYGVAGALADTDGALSDPNQAGTMVTGPAAADLPHGPAERTVEFWMSEQAPGGNEYALFEYGGNANGARFGLSITGSGGLHFEGYGTNLEFAAPTGHNLFHGPSGPAVWHHVALVYDGTSLTPYIDGISLGTVAIALNTGTTTPLRLGSALDSMGGNFPGSIDEFAIYPSALTADQINAHIAVSGRPPNAPAGLNVTAGPNQAAVSWAASTTNAGTPDLTAYSVHTLDGSGHLASVTTVPVSACTAGSGGSPGSCQVTVTGLAAGTSGASDSYTVQVAGVSPAGVGPSAVSSAFTPTGLSGSYRTLVLGASPDLYYRLDSTYRHGVPDFSGNGLDGYAPIAGNNLGTAGALGDDSDGALSDTSAAGPMVLGPAASALPHGADPRTVEFWMDEQAPGGNRYALFEYGGEGSGTRFGLSVTGSGDLRFEGYGTNPGFAAPTGHNLFNSGWHHVALVYDGTKLTPYVDGIGLTPVTIALNTGTTAGFFLRIGSAFDDMGGNFPGSIDEFAVYPTALTADQISEHYAAASAVYVPPIATTTQLTGGSGSTPSTYDDPVTFTASVSPAPVSAASGDTVTFNDGSLPLSCESGTGVFDASTGVESCQVSTLSAGTHSITAQYSGDSAYAGSTSNAVSQQVLVPTSTAVTFLPTNPTYGQDVTVSASVTSPDSSTVGAAPRGDVQFSVDGTAQDCGSSATLTNGSASCVLSGLSVGGPYHVTAVYGGDGSYASSTGAQDVSVAKAASSTSVTADPASSTQGDAVTFTATVSSPAGTPSGTVTFAYTTGSSTTSNPVTCTGQGDGTLDTAGKATCTTSSLPVGTDTVTASYSGGSGSNYADSSRNVDETVTAPSTGGGGGTPPASTVPTPPPAPSTATSFDSGSSSPGNPASATATDPKSGSSVSATGTGTGSLTVATYGSDPASPPTFNSSGNYVDVKIAKGSNFTSLTVTTCGAGSGTGLHWFDPSANGGTGGWPAVTPTPIPTAGRPGCFSVTLDGNSSPKISDLTGTVFGVSTSGFMATGPTRVLDTRDGTGAVKAQLGPKDTITLTVPNLPKGTTAVVLNLTATGLAGASDSYVSACPAAQSLAACTKTSVLNAVTGHDVANEVIVPVGSDGKVTLYNNAGSIDLVADLTGYQTGGYTTTGPTRVLDTRDGTGATKKQVGPKETTTLTVPKLPAGTTAVVLNLTATGLSGASTSYVSACPAAQSLAACTKTSALNAIAGQDTANEITIPVGSDGKITLYNNAGSIDLVADLVGFETGGYTTTGPTRVLDTRDGTGAAKAKVGPKGTITLTVPKLPAGTTAVVLNLTATGLTGASTSYVSACPAAQSIANCTKTSALNAITGHDTANEITVPVASDGKITLYNNAGRIDLVADLAGYQTSS